jgi:hypothetical protein
MENIIYITDEQGVEHALIDHGNGEFTSMPKAVYDEQQAEQSTPRLTDEAATK